MIDTSPGRLKVQGHVIADMSNYGEININTVIAKSSNVGTTKIAMMMEPSALRNRLALLGLGQPTATGFPGEEEGFLPSYATWRDLDRAALSYGYNLNITAIQLAQAYSVFANGGILQPLTLLAEGVTPKPTRIFKEETVRQVLPMLQAVTEEGGTARRAQISTYHVGGKTGTTMKYTDGSYASRLYISSFVGLAPIADPRFVMAISVDDPRSQQYYGGQIAAPVFADVMDDDANLRHPTRQTRSVDARGEGTLMRLDHLLTDIGFDDNRASGVEVVGLTLDSRQVVDGILFIAIQGSVGHGMDYIDAAIASGASAVIYDDWDGPVPNMVPALHISGLRRQIGRIAHTFMETHAQGCAWSE